MSNIIPFKRNKAPVRVPIGSDASYQALSVFKKKFLQDVNDNERFAVGMALFHEGVQQIVSSRDVNGYSDEDVRCLVALIVDSLLAEEMEIQSE